MNGWNSKFNARGEVVSGAGSVWFEDRQVAAKGWAPAPVTDDWIVFSGGTLSDGGDNHTHLRHVRTDQDVAYAPAANHYAAGGGRYLAHWLGDPITLELRDGRGTLLRTWIQAGTPAMSRRGRFVFATPYNAPNDIRTVHLAEADQLDPSPIYTGKTMDLSVCESAVCIMEATSVHGRKVVGIRTGQPPEDWSVLDWERPIVCDGPAGPWVLSVTQTGLILRPAGTKVGYQWADDYRDPDILFKDGLFHIICSTDRGVRVPLTANPADPRVLLTAPPPPPPPPPIGPRSDPRPHDGTLYDLTDFVIGDPSTWPRKGPTHPMNQVSGSTPGILYFVKFGDAIPNPGSAFELWAWDEHWLYQLEDASNFIVDHLTDPRWFPRRMAIGEERAFLTDEHERIFSHRGTCQEDRREHVTRRMWVHAVYSEFYCGPDLGVREVMVIAYDPTSWIYNEGRAIELGWYARGAGSFRWGSYRSDLLYPQGPHKTFAEFTDDKRLFPFSDFYLLGGPNTQPKLTGCAKPVVPSYPPWEETPPQPKEPPMPAGPSLHVWTVDEYPQVLDARRTFLKDPTWQADAAWVILQMARRYGFGLPAGEAPWSLAKMLAWESNPNATPAPSEPP